MPPADPIRIGYVLKRYPRLSETFIVTEILAHEQAGLDIEIFSLRPATEGRFHEILSRVRAKVNYLCPSRLRAVELWEMIRTVSKLYPAVWEVLKNAATEETKEIQQALMLARAIHAQKITHLHAHFGTTSTTIARLASRITGVPYSFTAHAKDIFHESVVHDDLNQKLHDASTVVTVSDYNLKFLRDGYGPAANRVRRIYNGLDLDEFSYQPGSNGHPRILAVGRLVEKKGFSVLVDACKLLKERGRDFNCDIIGDGDFMVELTQQIERLGLNDRVTMVGPRPRGEVIESILGANLMAAPCIEGADGNKDGLPTVLLEAMALGTPCVSTDVTGIPELVRHEISGLIAPQHDSKTLADHIERLLDDPQLSEQMSRKGREIIEENFDIHHNTAEMRTVFTGQSSPQTRNVAEAV